MVYKFFLLGLPHIDCIGNLVIIRLNIGDYSSGTSWNQQTQMRYQTRKTWEIEGQTIFLEPWSFSHVKVPMKKKMVPQNGWFITENPSIKGWFRGYHYFRKPHIGTWMISLGRIDRLSLAWSNSSPEPWPKEFVSPVINGRFPLQQLYSVIECY